MKNRTKLLLFLPLIFAACNHFEPEKLDHENFTEGSRQIHLDFHTSEHIENIGAQFDKKQFQEALITGNVNCINIFAKGHHSWCYYPTEVGMQHPHLDFDLMGQQIEACREIGVSVRLYFTVGWSSNDVKMHPEWAVLRKDGSNSWRDMARATGPGKTFGGWEYLAPEGPYAELILAQTEEILQKYEVDGIWYDIHQPEWLNYNAWSLQDMKERGIDPDDREAVEKRNIEKYHEFHRRTHDLIMSYDPDATLYYNGTTRTYNDDNIRMFKYGFERYNTKHDLEDLPTAWGGYDIFPWRSKYFANTGKEIVAMSGKFHKAWGEFGGFKDREAILYEAASMVAFGANCNFGDQLHPSGIMDMATYENIGYAYDYVEKIEEYGIGGIHTATTGLYLVEDVAALEGVVRMLCERQVNFNVVNTLEDWSDLEVLILPSGGVLPRDVERIRAFAEGGGKVLVMGNSAFFQGAPLVDIGATYAGKARYDVDYTLTGPELDRDMVDAPFLNYSAALRVIPEEGTEVLARIREPYFSRTLSHYCSHANTPYTLTDADHPAVIRKGNVVYMAHDLDRQYYREGARLHRDLFFNALDLLRTEPLVEADMPSMGRINLLHQPEHSRYVLHMLYASPIQRGNVRVIEDLVPLYDIPVSIDLEEQVARAYLIPSGDPVKFRRKDGKLHAVIPELKCHTALVLEY